VKTACQDSWPRIATRATDQTPASDPELEPASAPERERALIEAARRGDASALELLLSRHERRLYLLCRGILRRPEDAEDAVQETFLRALKSLRGLRSEAAVAPWLLRIAVNVCLEWKRRKTPLPLEPSDAAEPVGRSTEVEALERLAVTEALAALPVRGRTALLLKELEGWSAADIARALRCTERQVYYELDKALRTLAEWRRREDEAQ
jgi:RNA polymerase sigma-70 factor, ECF subfamily